VPWPTEITPAKIHHAARRRGSLAAGGACAAASDAGGGVSQRRVAQPVADRIAAFREGLKKEEFVQDRNVTFEFRWLEGQGYDRAGGRTQKCKIKYKKPTTDIGSGVSTAARRAAARRLLNVCCQFMTTGKFDTALPMRICSPSADDGCRQRLAADVEGDTAAPTSSL
jgi:hypothetical protein